MNGVPNMIKTRWLLGLLLGVFLPAAQAVVFDWDSVDWTAGGLSQSFDFDSSNAGNDITITITGSTGNFSSGFPDDNTDLTGGLSPAQENLKFDINHSNTSQEIIVTVTFHYPYGVDAMLWNFFDVDAGVNFFGSRTFVDEIRNIRATNTVGSTVYPSSITTSSLNTNYGSGSSQRIIGLASSPETAGTANATVNFGTNDITSFTFTYGSGTNSFSNPSQQFIGLHDFSFNVLIPEYHVGHFAAAGALFLVGWRALRRLRLTRA
jgi:hypothetical protein